MSLTHIKTLSFVWSNGINDQRNGIEGMEWNESVDSMII